MALPKLTASNAGAAARGVINAAIDAIDALASALPASVEAERNDRIAAVVAEGNARAAGITALGQSLTQEAVARDVGDRAVQALSEVRRFDFTQPVGRAGDVGLAFALVTSPFGLQGDNATLPLLPASLRATGDQGSVARVTGSAVLGMRRKMAIEPGRLYRARGVVQRRANPSDPSNDTVRFALAWLDQAGNLLTGASAFTVVSDLDTFLRDDGRQEIQTTFARSAGAGTLIVAPARARYARAFVQTYGTDGQTDIEVLDIDDISNATVLDAVSSDALSRLAALESFDTGERLDAVEAQLQTPSSLTYATQSDAQAASIPVSVTTLSLRGGNAAGDGLGRDYKRVSVQPDPGFGFMTADGAFWRRVDPLNPNWTGQPRITDGGPAWTAYTTSYSTLRVSVNDFPIEAQCGSNVFGIGEAITGAVNIPASATQGNHAAGVAGYGRSGSNSQGAVGLFGQGSPSEDGEAPGVSVWGLNTITTNCNRQIDSIGFDNIIAYGGELDFNIRKKADGSAPNVPLRGLYMIGDSNTMSLGIMRAIDIDTPGFFTPGVSWREVLYTSDGASLVGLNLGAMGRAGAPSDGQAILLRALGPAGAGRSGGMQLVQSGDLRLTFFDGAGIVAVDSAGALALQAAKGLFRVNADGQGAKTVTYGASDSAGAGFRTLRVPN